MSPPKQLSFDDLSLFDTLARPSAPSSETTPQNSAHSASSNGSLLLDLFSAPPPKQPELSNKTAPSSTLPPAFNNLSLEPNSSPQFLAPPTSEQPNDLADESFGDFEEFQSADPDNGNVTNQSHDQQPAPAAPLFDPSIFGPSIQQQPSLDDDNDDFGDFVDVTSQSPQQITSVASPVLPTLAPATVLPTTSSPPPLLNTPRETPHLNQYPIQTQINQLSAHDPAVPIKFGMHAAEPSSQAASDPSSKGSPSIAKQPKWEDVLSARKGTAPPSSPSHKKTPSGVSVSAPPSASSLIHASSGYEHKLVKSNVAQPPAHQHIDDLLIDTNEPSNPPPADQHPSALLDLLQFTPNVQQPSSPPQQTNLNDDDDGWSSFQSSEPSQPAPRIPVASSSSSPAKKLPSKPHRGPSPAARSILSSKTHRKTPSSASAASAPMYASLALPPEYASIPSSIDLLQLAHLHVLRVVEPLFASLVPLSYALKKRVLAAEKTRDFFKGYYCTLAIVQRIMAGRYRRLPIPACQGVPSQDYLDKELQLQLQADRQAREIERVWTQELVPRLRAAHNILPTTSIHSGAPRAHSTSGKKSEKYLDPDAFVLSAAAVVPKPAAGLHGAETDVAASALRQCAVCGLYPGERVPGAGARGTKNSKKLLKSVTKEMRKVEGSAYSNSHEGDHNDDENEWAPGHGSRAGFGHVTCLKFWEHRANYGI